MRASRARARDETRVDLSPRKRRARAATDVTLPSRAATEALGRSIGRSVKGGEVLALIGELGAGKTSLVRGIAAGLRAPTAAVSSPTFVLIHEYQGRLPLIHADLYRLRNEAEADMIGLPEYFNGRAVTAVEWADRFPALLPEDRLEVRLRHASPTVRTARLSACGPQSFALLSRIAEPPRARSVRRPHGAKSQRRRKAGR